MTAKRPDRRIGRTKRLLKAALLELIQERPYEEITIAEIADRADVGRSTFYSHFQSKQDLLLDGFDRALIALADSAPSSEPAGEGFRFRGDAAVRSRSVAGAIPALLGPKIRSSRDGSSPGEAEKEAPDRRLVAPSQSEAGRRLRSARPPEIPY